MTAPTGIEPPQSATWTRVPIDGVPIDPLREVEVVEHVMNALARGEGGVIITANADILRRLRSAGDRPLARRAALVVPDGMPLVWASRLQRRPVPERVTGADLVWSLSRAAAERTHRIYLLGAGPGVAAEAADALRETNPGLQVCGYSSPPLGFHADPADWDVMVADVTDAKPDLVFVALGFPKQEEVAFRLRRHLPQAWFLGCGGALDMAAGRADRAPAAMQSFGGEWMHRLAQEPRRLARRYLVDDAPYVAGMLVRARMARKGLRLPTDADR